MTATVLEMKMNELAEWTEVLNEAQENVEALKAEIKAEFKAREVEQMVLGKYVCRCKAKTTLRLDTPTFKLEQSEMYKRYSKPSTTIYLTWRTDEPIK